MSDSENVPMDATAEQAKAVVEAAIAWARSVSHESGQLMTEQEWELRSALKRYGDKYKGLRAR